MPRTAESILTFWCPIKRFPISNGPNQMHHPIPEFMLLAPYHLQLKVRHWNPGIANCSWLSIIGFLGKGVLLDACCSVLDPPGSLHPVFSLRLLDLPPPRRVGFCDSSPFLYPSRPLCPS